MKEFCKSLDEFVSKAEEWRETVENFRPAGPVFRGMCAIWYNVLCRFWQSYTKK